MLKATIRMLGGGRMMKEGYFVVTHDIDSVDINFVPDSPEAIQLFKDFNANMYGGEELWNIWNDFNELHDNGTIETWSDSEWKFRGYIIKDAFGIYLY